MASNIVYIARDIERALGKIPENEYFIITNETPYAIEKKAKYPDNIFLIKEKDILDTFELLSLEKVRNIISKLKAEIIVFKNTIHIEELCKEKNIKLLNPKATLSEQIENKISQITWLDELNSLLPSHIISITKDIEWRSKPIIIQWSHGHTGDGTILIKNEQELKTLKEKFPHREAKITDFIKGPMFTMNIVVSSNNIIYGNLSYQITGILPFTENPFSTIGNDWSIPHTILSESQIIEINSIAEKIAKKMQDSGWKGLFGIDIIHDEEKDNLYLIEINARQPASTTFESELQRKINNENMTIFDAHILTLIDISIDKSTTQINDGAQILQRVISKKIEIDEDKLIKLGYNIIKYSNNKPNADLLRIQSEKGIMETHNKFNKRGKEILEIIS